MKYVCSICGYVYDESQEYLTFQQLTESWVCPICKADQSLFVKEEKETKTTDMNISTEGDIVYSLENWQRFVLIYSVDVKNNIKTKKLCF